MTLVLPDALSFFRQSCGRWRSQRSNHHLLHRRAEAGASLIIVEELAQGDERLQQIAALNHQDPLRIIGGCWVRWSGSMAWDKAGEAHEDETGFGLIPTDERGRAGLLLRDRGYAEKAPVAGQFQMDDQDGLILTTDYEIMSTLERFWFVGPDVRLRTSTVEGFSQSASFCMETRVEAENSDAEELIGPDSSQNLASAADQAKISLFGW
ncbi:MAG: phycobiliprotein lyase [Prochlorococcus sp.]|nr:phycobiliprotein lyase [Prochlorococcaceae cyanobacterium Fu_MAG_50]